MSNIVYYPRLAKIFGKKLTAYIALARPFTLIPAVVVGLMLTISAEGLLSFTKGIYIGLTLALAQACGQIVNQVVDRDLDKIVKPYRPIPRGSVTVEEATGLAYLCALLAVARAFTVSIYFGLMTCVMLFMAVFYSLPPLSPRRVNPFLSLMWISFSRGLIPIIAVMGLNAWRYALLSLIWAIGWQGTKDIPDVHGDSLFNIKTIANTYGVKALKKMSLLFTVLYSVVCILLEKHIFLIISCLGVYGLLNYERPWRGENTVSWAIYYVGLSGIPVLILLEQLVFNKLVF